MVESWVHTEIVSVRNYTVILSGVLDGRIEVNYFQVFKVELTSSLDALHVLGLGD